MLPIAKFGFASGWKSRAAALLLMLMLALCSVCQARTPERATDLNANLLAGSTEHVEIQNYFLDYAGDHSLDAATVIEHQAVGYTKYIVQLHLTSGAQQSVTVSAPPGGLQVEMQDMTGDKIPNDVVLTPALARWLPTVLINDGHEHFRVAISSTDPSSFSSTEDLGSRKPDFQTFAWMLSSGFQAIYLANARRPFNPHHQVRFLSLCARTTAISLVHATNAGRAPPATFV